MTDDTDDLQKKRRKFRDSQERMHELIKSCKSYKTEEGTVYALPDISVPHNREIVKQVLEDVKSLWIAQPWIKHLTTYRNVQQAADETET